MTAVRDKPVEIWFTHFRQGGANMRRFFIHFVRPLLGAHYRFSSGAPHLSSVKRNPLDQLTNWRVPFRSHLGLLLRRAALLLEVSSDLC